MALGDQTLYVVDLRAVRITPVESGKSTVELIVIP